MKILDTSVLVDIDRGGVEQKVAKLDEEGTHAISMVTVTELRLGVELQYENEGEQYADAMDALDRLLSRFEILPVSRPVATIAAKIIATLQKTGQQLDDLHDVYIAATAQNLDVPVVTANVNHFDRIDEIRVIDWKRF